MGNLRVEQALGGGDSSGSLDPFQVREALALLMRPGPLADEVPKLLGELTKIAIGLSDIEIPERDPQFADASWRQHPVYRRLAQTYLACTQTIERLADDENADVDWQRKGRAKLFTDIVTGAMSPANFLPTNPAAVKRAIETGGRSVLRGARNFADDLLTNNGMPSMVDTSPFTVGVNLACSPGAVVHREEMFELLQYGPSTDTVHERPLLFVPAQMNRHYLLDLAPGRSLVEFAVLQGVQCFMLVWRNPRKDPELGHGKWGLDHYVGAAERAFDVVRQITGSEDLNVLGFCAGGVTSALAQAHLTATNSSPVHCATYMVTMIDARRPNMMTTLATPGADRELNRRAEYGEVIDGKKIGHHFLWMRPKDLVYGNLVNNWVMGESPGAFDLMAWNVDAANISATYTRDSIAMLGSGGLVQSGTATVSGTPIDLSAVKVDNFIVAAQADHITTWRPVYMTSQVLGGESEIVLINKGHVQSAVSPIPKSRHKYWSGPATGPDPDRWLAQAEQHDGSWWPHWADWIKRRSGPDRPASAELGSADYPPREPAPGVYVHEK